MSIDYTSARTVMERCDILATYSEEPDCLTRPSLTNAMRRTSELVVRWMQAAGLSVQHDMVGNLFGRYEASQPGAKTLLIGSHLDSVRDAGKYDGPLGVLIALACVERFQQLQERLPFAIEVPAFTGEEGLRFHCAYLGSKVATGTFDQQALHLTDDNAVSLEQAIRTYNSNDESVSVTLPAPRWQSADLLGYYEVHIEQGPLLESRELPVGVVSAIAGQSRFIVNFTGEAGHAGTVPIHLRRDALCAASEFILSVERLARDTPDLVATVGQINAQPGASNVIPGHVSLSLDVRHQNDATRMQACQLLYNQAEQICARRQVTFDWQLLQEDSAVTCNAFLAQQFAQAIEKHGYPVFSLPSGAGHDAVVMSTLTDVAMLFVRCKGGISHNPAESVAVEDVYVAIETLEGALRLLSQNLSRQEQ
jgi:allantoate deiminase